ncbi:cold-shock protein [Cardinium endosymbiont of Tipula unca]|uniref:cold-shock protein n=1 Tax=Cardinium endosymbiont of Tipula unca TaxID=3066216 RepID=UPI003BB0C4BB
MEGVVKWFDPAKGYGFIKPVAGGKDVFVHVSALIASKVSMIDQGQSVNFEITNDRGKEVASNIRILDV